MEPLAKKKMLTGIFVVPPLIAWIAVTPPWTFSLLVLVATFLGLREFFQLTLPHSNQGVRSTGVGLGLVISIAIVYGGKPEIFYPLVVFALLILFLCFMATSENLASSTSGIAISFLGVFYIGFLLAHIALLRQLAQASTYVLFLITTVWMGDISAFLCGSTLGKHKLYPKISPKKTFEGLLGAVVGSTLGATLFASLFLPDLGKGAALFLGAGIGVLGQFGDFTESMLKRGAQVKDSGSFIPGHGGMLDRLDSFLFSSPFLYYSLLFLAKEGR